MTKLITNDAQLRQYMPNVFATAQGETPAEPEPSKPTFRDRVATFFRDMRNRFLFVIYFIRYLFGIKT